ncbi:hypothetical protein RvY_11509-1 [Ramazzottius varieornatus]|uniref:Uncharacterized protein n=1 Tax=Ramazzottius varieornatus TaxID=947166 RepID=A0A1D1VGB8_RAMVA|nr:hypothetical protein RvY_11509-1 [Ramazzottius varieornatus]
MKDFPLCAFCEQDVSIGNRGSKKKGSIDRPFQHPALLWNHHHPASNFHDHLGRNNVRQRLRGRILLHPDCHSGVMLCKVLRPWAELVAEEHSYDSQHLSIYYDDTWLCHHHLRAAHSRPRDTQPGPDPPRNIPDGLLNSGLHRCSHHVYKDQVLSFKLFIADLYEPTSTGSCQQCPNTGLHLQQCPPF